MYALTIDQLEKLIPVIKALSDTDGSLNGDLYLEVKVTDLNDDMEVGYIGYDDNGVYGLVMESNERHSVPLTKAEITNIVAALNETQTNEIRETVTAHLNRYLRG